MLNVNDFSEAILDDLDSSDILSSSKAHQVWSDAIAEYLDDNLQIEGTYVGVCGGGSPDPYSGVHIWSPSSVTINHSSLMSGASVGGLDGWVNNVSSEINGGVIFSGFSDDGLVTCSSNCYPSVSISIQQTDFEEGYGLSGLEARDYMIDIVVNSFVSALKSSSLVPSSATGVGSCSTGTITWGNLY